jgi:DNA mismatch repair ATPase MutS
MLQTETPEQLKAYNDGAGKGQKRKVVRREAVAVLSQGLLTDPGMLSAFPHSSFVATVMECSVPEDGGDRGSALVGICAVDAASGRVVLDQFTDTQMRPMLLQRFTGVLVLGVLRGSIMFRQFC